MENEPVKEDNKKGATAVKLQVVGVILAILLAFLGVSLPIQILYYILVGWFFFLQEVIPRMIVSMSGVVTAVLLLAIIAGFVQLLGVYAFRRLQAHHPKAWLHKWRVRYTCAFLILLMISFVGGFSVVGVAHQTSWFVTRDDAVVDHGMRQYSINLASKNNLKQIGLGNYNYHETESRFPIGGTFSSTGQPQHSWVTRLLPYLDQVSLYNKIDFDQPWTAKANREYFQNRVYVMQNPVFKTDYDNNKNSDEVFQGYQPAHYAANSHVFGVNVGMNNQEITDGTSNTILAGEIIFNIKPWSDPTNIRDPALGINKHVDGFGAPWKSGGAHMGFLDGSVRFISNDIDPAVLKALATPNRGDSVGDYHK